MRYPKGVELRFLAKSVCKICGQWFEDSELDEHLNQHMEEPDETQTELKPVKCPSCDIDTDAYHAVPFKIGRSDVAARLLIGWRSELGEEPILIDLYVCPKCGRLQQFVNHETRQKLRRSASAKQSK